MRSFISEESLGAEVLSSDLKVDVVDIISMKTGIGSCEDPSKIHALNLRTGGSGDLLCTAVFSVGRRGH